MQHPTRVPLLLTILVLVALAGADAAASRRQVPQGFLGVDAEGPMGTTGVNVAGEFGTMARTGVESVRLPLYWSLAQPTAEGPIDYSASDRLIGGAAARAVGALPIVLGTPAWARERPDDVASPPRDPATYGAFMTALVQRYGPGGAFWRAHPKLTALPVQAWQVWNEPAEPFYWTDQPFAPSYVRLLAAARAAIKTADPGARVVLAGLNSGYGHLSWTDLAKVYEAGGRRLFDVTAQNPFSRRPVNVIRSIKRFRAVMDGNGDRTKPTVISELSWPSALGATKLRYGFEVTERVQAQRISEALPLLARLRSRLHIAQVFWHTWLSPPLGSPQPFDYAGLRRQSTSGVVSKPALAAYRRVARRLEGCGKASVATRCG